ncbi:MAG: GNAT family N-acetyltransferase [Bradymonadia bacterium]
MLIRPHVVDDDSWLLALRQAIKAQEIRLWGLPEAEAQSLAAVQTQAWMHSLEGRPHFIVEIDGLPVGAVVLEQTAPHRAHLVDISVHPDWQGQGLGRHIMAWVQQQASEIELEVITHLTGLVSWYQRLGFTVVDDLGPHLHMRWVAQPPKALETMR